MLVFLLLCYPCLGREIGYALPGPAITFLGMGIRILHSRGVSERTFSSLALRSSHIPCVHPDDYIQSLYPSTRCVCVHGDVSPAHTSVRIRSRLLSVLSRQLLYAGAVQGGFGVWDTRVTDANATTAQTQTDSESGTEQQATRNKFGDRDLTSSEQGPLPHHDCLTLVEVGRQVQ